MRAMAIHLCFFIAVMEAAIVTAQHLTVVPGVPQTASSKTSSTIERQFKVMETPIQFKNRQGKWLRGMFHWPEGATKEHPAGTVVFFHGFTGDRIESHWIFVKTARALAQAGIASLRFDFYGSGESEGQFAEMTLQGEMADAEDAVRFLRLQAGVDPSRIGLCGLSMGGSIAASIAAPVQANAVVLWSAVAHMDHLRRVIQKNRKPIADTDGYLEFDAREVSTAFLNHLDEVNPVEAISRYAGPVLIIQPEKDEVVPLSHAVDLYEAARTKDKEKFIVAGANHTYSSLIWESEVIRRTVDWFQEHLVH